MLHNEYISSCLIFQNTYTTDSKVEDIHHNRVHTTYYHEKKNVPTRFHEASQEHTQAVRPPLRYSYTRNRACAPLL